MSLLCSITGQVATQPVLNPANGRVYEKRMIEQHLLTSTFDPVSNEPLSLSSLIPISPASLALPPYVSSASPASLSLSSLLSTLQREYDGVMLEQFQLRRENFSLKQELASALYQYDAACRVIARLVRERDEAKAALIAVAASSGAERAAAADGSQDKEEKERAGRQDMELEGERKAAAADEAERTKALSAEVTAVFEETSKRLGAKNRKAWVKQRAAAAVSREEVRQYGLTASFALHSASITGVNAVDIDESGSGGRLLLTGGQDGSVSLFDAAAGRLTESLRGHKKRVTDVAFLRPAQPAPSQQTTERLPLLSSSADHTVHLYTFDPEQRHYTTSMVYSSHAAAVTAVSVHPSGQYFASGSADGCYCLHSLSSTAPLVSATTPSPLSWLSFHPDGRILATTHADRAVRVYDVLQSQCVASLSSHAAPTTTVAFSPNGYQCATGDEQGRIHLWDLRRVSNEKQADVASVQAGDAAVSSLCFDDSGGLLVGGVGSTVAVWESGKDLTELLRLDGHSAEVRAVKVAQGGSWFVSASKDRTVKLWGKRQTEQQAAASSSSSSTEMTG